MSAVSIVSKQLLMAQTGVAADRVQDGQGVAIVSGTVRTRVRAASSTDITVVPSAGTGTTQHTIKWISKTSSTKIKTEKIATYAWVEAAQLAPVASEVPAR